MKRRTFIQFCAAAAGASGIAAPALPARDARPRRYARTLLEDAQGRPLRASRVPVERNLIFHYPYAATPCFLLNLGRAIGAPAQLKTAEDGVYEWPGGIGPQRSIVAYSAICAHQLTYPTREISFISYRTEKSAQNRFENVIHCCSEHSQYDPAQGARVLAGPAPQPLAAILLEHDTADDALYAVGTLGGEMFNAFFAKYAFRLSLERGDAARDATGAATRVTPLDDYCRQQVRC
ncbi:MAG: (2Fe-2S)-binding protein [Burkholderiales bacterium]|nr:(2Fe-2S)-binding protein [Burkholderiales bacterium]